MSLNNNLFAVFQQYFPQDRSKVFLTDGDGRQVSYAEMEALSGQFANYFLSLGLSQGDRVAVQLGKSSMALMVYLAAVRAGLV